MNHFLLSGETTSYCSPGAVQLKNNSNDSKINRLPVKWSAKDQDQNNAKKAWAIIRSSQKNSSPDHRKLHVFYFTFNDQPVLNNYKERLDRVMKNIQAYYADQMSENGFPPLTFSLDLDNNGTLLINDIHIESNLAGLNASEVRQLTTKAAAKALESKGLNIQTSHVLYICRDVQINRIVSGYGRKEFGRCWANDLICLDPYYFPSRKYYGGYYNETEGKTASIYIGTMAHEIGHLLALRHVSMGQEYEEKAGTSLMGDGNYHYGEEFHTKGNGTCLAPANALSLASNPIVNGFAANDSGTGTIEFEDLSFQRTEDGFTLKGRVKYLSEHTNHKCYAVTAWFDPLGDEDYDALAFNSIPDENGLFHLEIKKPGHSGYFKLNLTTLVTNGDQETIESHAWLTKDDVIAEDLLDRAYMAPLYSLWEKYDREKAQTEYQRLIKKYEGRTNVLPFIDDWEKAFNFDQPTWLYASPSEVQEASKISLVDCKPASSKSGFYFPCWDSILPMDLGVRPFFYQGTYKRYIMSHAPGHLTYDLNGKWRRLTASIGIPIGRQGSVRVIIRGDDHILYFGDILHEGRRARIDIPVDDVKKLHMEFNDANDGSYADWIIIGNPVLAR